MTVWPVVQFFLAILIALKALQIWWIVIQVLVHCLGMWALTDKINTQNKNFFITAKIAFTLPAECLSLCFSLSRQDWFFMTDSHNSFALLIIKIPGAGTDSVSEVQCKHSKWFSQGKIKFLKWLLLKSFFFFWCTRSRKDLQVQEEHSSIRLLLLKGELCSLVSQYSIPVAHGAWARWKGGVPPHTDPTQTSAWQRLRPSHRDKTQDSSVWHRYKWFLYLIRRSCSSLLPAERW